MLLLADVDVVGVLTLFVVSSIVVAVCLCYSCFDVFIIIVLMCFCCIYVVHIYFYYNIGLVLPEQ